MPDPTDGFQAQHQALLASISRRVEDAWVALGSWDTSDVPRFVRAVDPLARAARLRAITLVDAYTASLSRTPPLGLARSLAPVVSSPRGVEPLDLWRRPFITTWSALADGSMHVDARSLGRVRAVTIAQQDTQMAVRAAMDAVVAHHSGLPDEAFQQAEARRLRGLRDRTVASEAVRLRAVTDRTTATVEDEPEADERPRRIVAYRRVLTGRSCMFCAAAATKTYGGPNLMPLHAHCDCGVAPVFADDDPGEKANKALLRNLKAQGPEYWKSRGFVDNDGNPLDPTRVPERLGRTTEHPEIGPVLAAAA